MTEVKCAYGSCVDPFNCAEALTCVHDDRPQGEPGTATGRELLTQEQRDQVDTITAAMRKFETGATRNVDDDNHDYEGFLSPLVIKRFGEYMHGHRRQADGTIRASDNWQKGIPLESYMKSGWRHFLDWWMNHRELEARDDVETALCALLFNVQGYLHETLKAKLVEPAGE